MSMEQLNEIDELKDALNGRDIDVDRLTKQRDEARQQLAAAQADSIRLREALTGVLWNENQDALRDIAREALAATDNLNDVILCHAEPVAYLDANYGFMRCGNVADSLSIGTQLYAPKMEPK